MVLECKSFTPYNGIDALSKVATVCIGSGRFLRAVLVPAVEIIGRVAIFQPRGNTFVQYMNKTNGVYELDTVLTDGRTKTTYHHVEACGSLGDKEERAAFMELPRMLPNLAVIGIGITEAGLTEKNQTITDLFEFLQNVFNYQKSTNSFRNISIINTDNLFPNGEKLNQLISALNQDTDLQEWLATNVTFHNSMVDRITSHRDGNECIPKAEPLPSKALVIEDARSRLPVQFKSMSNFGVQVCSDQSELLKCISLKLLVANATHTSMVYSMALCGFSDTSACLKNSLFLELIDGQFWHDIWPGFEEKQRTDAVNMYEEWTRRLQHPFFEMNTFFICQNATQKFRKKF